MPIFGLGNRTTVGYRLRGQEGPSVRRELPVGIDVQAVTDFIVQHGAWAGPLVFLAAALEAVAVVGTLVPGTAIVVGVAAVAGLGHLSLPAVLIWAVLGAVAGDGLSYWLGRRLRRRVLQIWPFSRRPQLIDDGAGFMARHGSKSIVLGRVVPWTRAVVPMTAGVTELGPWRFLAADVIAALVWAAVFILPGAGVGAGLKDLLVTDGRVLALGGAALVLFVLAAWYAWSRRQGR